MQQLLSKSVVERIKEATRLQAAALIDEGIEPQLGVILVGDHPDSLKYISIKSKQAKEQGIILSLYHLESESTQEEVMETIRFLNEDEDMHGIILQLPLPAHFSPEATDALLNAVAPEKDVDGLRGDWQGLPSVPLTLDQFLETSPLAIPPMVCAILSLLSYYQIGFEGKKTVVIGEGRLVGGPVCRYLEKLGFEVDSVNEETPKILDRTAAADIVISGTGQNDLVTYQWVKEGAVVVDCASDIHADSVGQVASALAPSVGGVGPLTVAWLLNNTVQAAYNLNHRRHD